MKTKKAAIILMLISFAAFIFYFSNNQFSKKNTDGIWQIEVVDEATQKKIEDAEIIVTNIDKKFNISYDNNKITLPQKPNSMYAKNNYPYGYTIITYSNGYLPRIDHNIQIGSNGITNLSLTLEKAIPFNNQSYTEYFHYSPQTAVAEMFNYYNINQ